MFSGFCQCYMKEHLYWDAQLWGYSLFSVYLQRCMNIWLMSHSLWRNLITVLLYKARPLTVNTAANNVIDTATLSESNIFCGVNSLVKKKDLWETLFSYLFWTLLNLQALICKDFSSENKQWYGNFKMTYFKWLLFPEISWKIIDKQKAIDNSLQDHLSGI